MSSWPLVRLGDICEKITDGTHHSPANHAEGDFKYITAKNIKPWGLDLSDVTYIDAATHREIYARCDVRKGDVLYVKDGVTTGRVAINPLSEEFSLLSSVAVLRPGPAVQAKYLAFALQEARTLDRMLADMAGVAITRLTLRKLNEAEIPLAPLSCQTRIVEKLEELLPELDDGVAELKAAQRKLAQYRQSLLKAAVEGALTAGWRAARARSGEPQETGADLLQRILTERRARWEAGQLAKYAEQGKAPASGWKAKYVQPSSFDSGNLPPLPDEWAWASVSACGDVQLGRQRAPKFHSGANMVPYLRVANVFEERIDISDVMAMHFSKEEEDTYRLSSGDILLNEGQSLELVGRPAIYRDELKRACFTNTLVRFRAADGVLPEYALIVFLHYMHSGRFQKIAKITTNIAHLGAGRFAELEFPLPSLEEQAQIVERVDEMQAAIQGQTAAVTRALKQAAAQRKNILKAAFAGQLVPQDPNDEPASVLLERIRAERAARDGAPEPRGRKPRTTA